MFCPKCGEQSDGKFCRSCGTDLGKIAEKLTAAAPKTRSIAAEQPAITRERETGAITRGSGGSATALGLFHSAFLSNENRSLDGQTAGSIFGTVVIDLTAAPLPPGETRISIFSIFGTAEVLVPENVAVRVTGVNAFGSTNVRGEEIGVGIFSSTNETTPGYEQATRRLRLDVTSIFSAVKIGR